MGVECDPRLDHWQYASDLLFALGEPWERQREGGRMDGRSLGEFCVFFVSVHVCAPPASACCLCTFFFSLLFVVRGVFCRFFLC